MLYWRCQRLLYATSSFPAKDLVLFSNETTLPLIFDSYEDVRALQCEGSSLEQDFTNCNAVTPTGLDRDYCANSYNGDIVHACENDEYLSGSSSEEDHTWCKRFS